MKIFVISLKRAVDRRQRITTHLNSMGVDFELIDAVDGSLLTEDDLNKYCDMEIVKSNPVWFTKGMIGCSLAHFSVYKKIIQDNIPYACVFEDDVIIDKDFKGLMKAIEMQYKGNTPTFIKDSLIMLHYTSWNTIELKTVNKLYGRYSLYQMNSNAGLNSGAGYIVTQEMCKKLTDNILPIRRAADSWTDFAKDGVIKDIYCVYPKPVNIVFAKSTIDYMDSKSLASKLSQLVNDYKIFPFYQLLKYRRKAMNKNMNKVTILS